MSAEPRWLLLIHQIPPKPGYLRVKAWRQLQRLGAVAVKNSVYVLPRSDQASEDLQWVLRAIVEGGGDGSICEARFAEGLSDDQVEALFHAARDADYAQVAGDAKGIADDWPAGAPEPDKRTQLQTDVARLRRRFLEVAAIDFFGASGRETTEGLLTGLESRLRRLTSREGVASDYQRPKVRGSTWVTRKGIHVDRMASAWLIQRFIDTDARFKFVEAKGYRPEPGELRFDMFEAEFTHEGDRCTFEVLLDRFDLAEPSLDPLAEIVHNIDVKDEKFGRPETEGIASLVAGIAMAHRDDEARLVRASAVFDDLHEYFRRKEPGTKREKAPRAGRDRT